MSGEKVVVPSSGWRIAVAFTTAFFFVFFFPQLPNELEWRIGVAMGVALSFGLGIYAKFRGDVPVGKFLVECAAGIGALHFLALYTSFPQWLTRPLMLPEPPGNAQAIFVLASGVTPHGAPNYSGFQRFMKGYSLLKAGRAPKMFISTGDYSNNGFREIGWVSSLTALLGMASGSCEILDGAFTTRTEALAAERILIPQGIRRILLVTSGPHIYRGTRCFEKVGFEVLPAASQTPEAGGDCLENGIELLRYVMHEWCGLLVYRARGHISLF